MPQRFPVQLYKRERQFVGFFFVRPFLLHLFFPFFEATKSTDNHLKDKPEAIPLLMWFSSSMGSDTRLSKSPSDWSSQHGLYSNTHLSYQVTLSKPLNWSPIKYTLCNMQSAQATKFAELVSFFMRNLPVCCHRSNGSHVQTSCH